jgi:hypothetical protein
MNNDFQSLEDNDLYNDHLVNDNIISKGQPSSFPPDLGQITDLGNPSTSPPDFNPTED